MTARQYLDIYKAWTFIGTEAVFGTGKTLRVRWSQAMGGNPATVPLIGTLEKTATLSSGVYTIPFLPADFEDLLTAGLLRNNVYAHISDGAGWRDALAYYPVDIDPSLLSPLID